MDLAWNAKEIQIVQDALLAQSLDMIEELASQVVQVIF